MSHLSTLNFLWRAMFMALGGDMYPSVIHFAFTFHLNRPTAARCVSSTFTPSPSSPTSGAPFVSPHRTWAPCHVAPPPRPASVHLGAPDEPHLALGGAEAVTRLDSTRRVCRGAGFGLPGDRWSGRTACSVQAWNWRVVASAAGCRWRYPLMNRSLQ